MKLIQKPHLQEDEGISPLLLLQVNRHQAVRTLRLLGVEVVAPLEIPRRLDRVSLHTITKHNTADRIQQRNVKAQ